jgi:hypothetical protein
LTRLTVRSSLRETLFLIISFDDQAYNGIRVIVFLFALVGKDHYLGFPENA